MANESAALLAGLLDAQNETMNPKTTTVKPARRYESPDIPMSAINRYARQIVEKFQPDKVILFGSYAKGEQRKDSDVDLLVVMPAWNEMSKAARISYELEAPFMLDLIVRTPERLSRRIKEGDWFLREVIETGKVLYAKHDQTVGSKSRSRLVARGGNQTAQPRSQ